MNIVYEFTESSDGLYPDSPLIDVGGLLYGTTGGGGQSNNGTVFSYDPASGQETALFSFPAGGADGGYSYSSLVNMDGLLYGTAYIGGAFNFGVVYSIDPSSGQQTVVHSFTAGECGYPRDGLIAAHGLLYGVAYEGGAAQSGCVYSVDPTTGQFASLHQFAGPPYDGAAGLTRYTPDIYGVAAGGGIYGLGSIYRFHPATGTGETLYSFDGADGGRPSGAMTEVAGMFYGATTSGGAENAGTVFRFDPAKRAMTVLYDFPSTQTGGSSSRLTLADNALFGLTATGGFALDLATLQVKLFGVEYRVAGSAPDLTLANGLLYGTNLRGHTGVGDIFGIDPATDRQKTHTNFERHAKGIEPDSDLTFSDGLLYGLTQASGYPEYDKPTLYQYDPATGVKTTLHVFQHTVPTGLALVPEGHDLLGAAYVGTAENEPAIMRIDPVAGTLTFDDVGQLGGAVPVTPLLRAYHGFYFDSQAPCTGCTTPTAGMLYRLLR